MVSTRGPKFKFSEGERVLCYEPDPTKAKVLYDSKVLEVKVNKDQRGRKAIEFLIHFQGWNSSWDRCVTEDYVLKDTEENRQLQQDLAHKAQLQLCSNYRRGAYLYRKDRTKRRRKLSDRINDSLERQKGRRRLSTSASATSNSNASGTSVSGDSDDGSLSDDDNEDANEDERDDEERNAWGQNSSDESSEAEDDRTSEEVINERIPISVSAGLKTLLEHDNYLITRNDKIIKLPAEPNVVSILEGFVKHCAVNQLCNSHSSHASRNGHSHRYSYKFINHNKTRDLDAVCRSLNTCKEVADGLRVYFDFILSDLLLYSEEKLQFVDLEKDLWLLNSSVKKEPESVDECGTMDIKIEITDTFENHNSEPEKEKEKTRSSRLSPVSRHSKTSEDIRSGAGELLRKRNLRSSHKNTPDANPPSTSTPSAPSNGLSPTDAAHNNSLYAKPSGTGSGIESSVASPPAEATECDGAADSTSPRSNALLSQIMNWRLVPSSMRTEKPPPPSLVYGATHLARLFVRLPDLLYTGTMPKRKLKVLTSHLETFMGYLEEHTEWFADHNYKDNCYVHRGN